MRHQDGLRSLQMRIPRHYHIDMRPRLPHQHSPELVNLSHDARQDIA